MKLQPREVLAVGMMTFALFLGAGNLIFPPTLGQQAGDHLLPAILGFLLTGVGLPLLGVVAAARMGGGLNVLTGDLPRKIAITIGVLLYLAIGPLFATPRTGLVAYEFSLLPVLGENAGTLSQLLYSLVFFGVSLALSLYPAKLVESVGKLITPLLVIVLGVIAAGTFLLPQGSLQAAATEAMQQRPFAEGFIQGYQTMDTLGALAFGIVIINALRSRGVTDAKLMARYTSLAGVIAAVGLAAVYITLGYLGGTSLDVAAGAGNGAQIINLYIAQIFGGWGQWLLGLTITLACLSTSIGLISACAAYFNEVFPQLGYKTYAVIFALISALIANVGLAQLINFTIPALLMLYPISIGLILLCLIRARLNQPRLSFMVTLAPVCLLGVIDGLAYAKIGVAQALQQSLGFLPLADAGLGWIVPGLIALALSQVIARLMPTPALQTAD